MFLRRNRRHKNGELYEYWTLVESVRTARGPRQRVVATLGKLPGLEEDERAGWEEITRLLDGRPRDAAQRGLFDDAAEPPQWAQVNVAEVRVERVRQFGKVYVALALWRRLGLHRFFDENVRRGREQIDWATVVCILSVGRFCAQSSERALSEHWYAHTALDDLLGISTAQVYDNRLYRGLDELLPLREVLFEHLRERYRSMFGAGFEFLLYDVTSTYFEGQCEGNPQAQRGYSRDKRPDCKQVCIGLVVTLGGLPLAYEVFAGNRSDVTTVEEIVDLMESKYGRAERIWAMDRGLVSEENLDYLRESAKHCISLERRRAVYASSSENCLRAGTGSRSNRAWKSQAGRSSRRRGPRAVCSMSQRSPAREGGGDTAPSTGSAQSQARGDRCFAEEAQGQARTH
jgi:hypothetical protein